MDIYNFFESIEAPERLNGYLIGKNKPIKYIKPLSRLNIFIGTNNSGKSLLMRELLREIGVNSHQVQKSVLNDLDILMYKAIEAFTEVGKELGVIKSVLQSYL